MKCPFQWTEKDHQPAFKDSHPIRTRRFIECEKYKCPAYIPEETIEIGGLKAYISESCRMLPNNQEAEAALAERKKNDA